MIPSKFSRDEQRFINLELFIDKCAALVGVDRLAELSGDFDRFECAIELLIESIYLDHGGPEFHGIEQIITGDIKMDLCGKGFVFTIEFADGCVYPVFKYGTLNVEIETRTLH